MLTEIKDQEPIFRFKGQTIRHQDPTLICGIVNVTPDSFSDGGQWFERQKAIDRAKFLISQGCRMIDVGGESTRPGSTYVEVEEEIRRVIPVIQALKQETDAIISIDTWKAPVAQAAIEAGVDVVNDITGLLGAPQMAKVLAQSDVGVVLMANPVLQRPDHPSAKIFPSFGGQGVFSPTELDAFQEMEVVELMKAYFEKSLACAQTAGIHRDRLMLDPGIGFGLTKKENYALVKQAELIHQWGFTCFLGVSRKRFIQNTLQEAGYPTDPADPLGYALRDQASAALTAVAAFMGIEVVRVHVGQEHAVAALIASHIRQADRLEDVHLPAYGTK